MLIVLKESPGSLLISFVILLNKLHLNDIFVTKVIFTFFFIVGQMLFSNTLSRIQLS